MSFFLSYASEICSSDFLRVLQGHNEIGLADYFYSWTYVWPGMTNDIDRFVRRCHICTRSKVRKEARHGFLKPLEIPGQISLLTTSLAYMYGLDNRLFRHGVSNGCRPWLSHMYRKVSLRSHEDLWVWGVQVDFASDMRP